MSAKPSKKAPPPPAAPAVPATAGAGGPPAASAPPPRWRQAALIGIWFYVAALWVLALDQTFNWGLFGPKLPPLS